MRESFQFLIRKEEKIDDSKIENWVGSQQQTQNKLKQCKSNYE
jgi:hypothetical protein